jgi:hypothetical protein
VRRIDDEILAADQVPVDVDCELTAGDRQQLGMLAHPRHHSLSADEMRKYDFGRRLDVDRG